MASAQSHCFEAQRTHSQRSPISATVTQNNNIKMSSVTDGAHIYITATFGYTFKNLNLLYEALDTTGLYRVGGNSRLAMIGDSVLQSNILRDWYPTGQTRGECPRSSRCRYIMLTYCVPGVGNQLVSSTGCNANLARVALKIGLDRHMLFNPGTSQGVLPSDRWLATTVEAVIGAIDCDSGESASAVRDAMKKIGLTAAATQ